LRFNRFAMSQQAASAPPPISLASPGGQTGSLRLYLAYRFLLALGLLLMFASGEGPSILGSHLPELFALTTLAYLGLTLVSMVFFYLGFLKPATSCYIAIFVDIVAIVLLTHASGGVSSGLGSLLAVSIAWASVSLVGRTALLFAALATLGVMTEQLYGQLADTFTRTAYTHAGLLGTSFFALALLAHQLSQRLQRSEQLAHQRGFDLANLAELNEYVIQHLQAGVVVVDEDERVRLMNDSAWYLLGMPEGARGRALIETSPALAAQLAAWRADRRGQRPSFRPVTGGRDLRADFTPLGEQGSRGALIFLEDTALVTERAQQLKLASLGRLTASIAHEIRNPLGAISHAAQLMQESGEMEPTDRRLADIIQQNSGRLNDVVENVLRLSRRHEPAAQALALRPWLEKQAEHLLPGLGVAPSQVEIDVAPDDVSVYVDPGQLQQILAVLLENAVRHFAGSPEDLRINLSAKVSREAGGPYLDVVDNGPGIKPEEAGKLFEPFYTTRPTGTGLGLYIARELAETNRCRLDHVPLASRGACFRLSLPDARDLDR
jgi:two-component system sensor histidine kinase PilS (NtrC family)